LFPVKRQNLLTCTFCGTTVVVPEEHVPQLMAQAQQPAGPPAQSDPYQAQPNPYQAQPNPYQAQPNPYQAQPNPYQAQPPR
jgi:hypothetical protein